MDSDFILLVIKGFAYWSFSFQIIISYRIESEEIDCFMESESEVSNMGETECFWIMNSFNNTLPWSEMILYNLFNFNDDLYKVFSLSSFPFIRILLLLLLSHLLSKQYFSIMLFLFLFLLNLIHFKAILSLSSIF